MDKELIYAMLDGKTLVCNANKPDQLDGYFDSVDGEFIEIDESGCKNDLYFGYKWQIKPEPKKRPMTTGEAMVFSTDNRRIVVRYKDHEYYYLATNFVSNMKISEWRYNELKDDGTLKHEEWKYFEVVDNE